MLLMATNSGEKAPPKSVRIDADLLKRLLAIGDKAQYKPTITQLFEAAIQEYVERHEADPARARKK